MRKEYKKIRWADERAAHFIECEKEFHLGGLVTEQSHPATASLSDLAKKDIPAALRLLLSVDYDIAEMLARSATADFISEIAEAMARSLSAGGRIIFTGCGATGRLAILLDAMWRRWWKNTIPSGRSHLPYAENRVVSVMAGGDYALIRSVEGYEDCAGFGVRQMRDLNVSSRDLVIAVTEGGETSFVIGTARAAADAFANVFFVYNNPDSVLLHIRRSREILEDSRIRKICLATGPMAIMGSTRMQAVTAEFVVLGFSLECALRQCLKIKKLPHRGMVDRLFIQVLKDIRAQESITTLSSLVSLESQIYRESGLITYLADTFSLDLLTDTTERFPTFLVPPFIQAKDKKNPLPWAYMVRPELSSSAAWRNLLARKFNDIKWGRKEIEDMSGKEFAVERFPDLSARAITGFDISSRSLKRRLRGETDGFIVFAGDQDLRKNSLLSSAGRALRYAGNKTRKTALVLFTNCRQAHDISRFLKPYEISVPVYQIALHDDRTLLQIFQHVAFKMCINAFSTVTMTVMGRVMGNCMVYVSPGNKKLIDRASRFISQLTGRSYADSCNALFHSMDLCARERNKGVMLSPVLTAVELLSQKSKH